MGKGKCEIKRVVHSTNQFKNDNVFNDSMGFRRTLFLSCTLLLFTNLFAQQFNSDSWVSKPHGTITIIPTMGERNSMLMTTYSLFPKWEFTVAGYLYNDDDDPLTNDGYSTSLYAKYMFYENAAKTGGFAMKAGRGLDPGYLDGEQKVKDATKTFWMNAPATIPFFDNKLSWDIMPGVNVTQNYEGESSSAWAFTYTTRLAYYPFSPKLAAVGELFGSEGKKVYSLPEYRVGLRWEPSQYANIALTYGAKFNGSKGAGFEIGIMIFTPPFACIGKCKPQ